MLGIKKNILLSRHTTFKIGGPAKYFFKAKTKEELIKALKWARTKKVPFFILGGGSNVLVSDKGFKGLVIKLVDSNVKLNGCRIDVSAGMKLDDVVEFCLKHSLSGLEWLAGIPGTIGGAIRGDAEAFENRISDNIEKVEVFEKGYLNKKQCKFGSKQSIFKKNNKLVILSAVLKVKKGNKDKIKKKIDSCLKYRKEKHPLKYPSAGSVFKNNGRPSSYLIDKAGLKGKRIGKAEVSKKHAGFIINLGGAKAADVLRLISLIKRQVKKKFGINLKQEIQYLGF